MFQGHAKLVGPGQLVKKGWRSDEPIEVARMRFAPPIGPCPQNAKVEPRKAMGRIKPLTLTKKAFVFRVWSSPVHGNRRERVGPKISFGVPYNFKRSWGSSPTLTTVGSNKQRLGYKSMEATEGKLGLGRTESS